MFRKHKKDQLSLYLALTSVTALLTVSLTIAANLLAQRGEQKTPSL